MSPQQKIHAIQARLGWTLNQLAEWLDAPRGTVYTWGSGNRTPSQAVIDKIDALEQASRGYGSGASQRGGVGLDTLSAPPKPGDEVTEKDSSIDALLKLGLAAFVGWLILREQNDK